MEEEEVEEVLRASGARERVRDTLPPSSSWSRSRSRSRSGDSPRHSLAMAAPRRPAFGCARASATASATSDIKHYAFTPSRLPSTDGRRDGHRDPTPTDVPTKASLCLASRSYRLLSYNSL